MGYDIFVSYSTNDKHFVDALVNKLEGSGIRCWYAPRDIPAGTTWPAAITAAIKESALMLLVFSESANISQEVSKELTLASSHKRLVVPVRIENVPPNAEMEYHLVNRHWLDVYGLEVDAAIGSIMESLRNYADMLHGTLPPPEQGGANPLAAAARRRGERSFMGKKGLLAAGAALLVLAAGIYFGMRSAPSSLPTPSAPAATPGAAPAAPDLASLARSGDAEAQWKLGRDLVKTQPEQAHSWLLKAAGQGQRDAQHLLGDLHYSGIGVKSSYEQAARWYLEAAKNNHTEAQTSIGDMYHQGIGVPRDTAQAFGWYQKAANQGNAAACYSLGDMYEQGESVQASPATAFKWYFKAAEAGYASAQYKVGAMYWAGAGVRQNTEEALRWLKKAAEQGDGAALELLGQIR